MHCEMFNGIPGLYPLDTSNIPFPLIMTTKNVFRDCLMLPGGEESSLVKCHHFFFKYKT